MKAPLDGIEFVTIEQCTADPLKVKIVAQADQEFGTFLPHLLALDPRATLNERGGYVAMKVGEGNVTLFASGKVTATKLRDEEAARAFLDDLRERINALYERREAIDLATLRMRRPISILGILKLLPRTNCGQCGQPTCMAFAMRIISGEARAPECAPLFSDGSLATNKDALINELQAAGYGHLAELG